MSNGSLYVTHVAITAGKRGFVCLEIAKSFEGFDARCNPKGGDYPESPP